MLNDKFHCDDSYPDSSQYDTSQYSKAGNITALSRKRCSCHICLSLNPLNAHCCEFCGERLHSRNKNSMQNTIALLVTSIVLYIPANILPIMYTQYFGEKTASTIFGGVLTLWSQGSYPIALIIFFASVLVPVAKIVALSWLCYSVLSNRYRSYKKNHRLYRLTEFVGRWSMVDVFVVAILVALIQMGSFMSVHPGEAALAFGALVITTMIAAITFDSRLIWEPINSTFEFDEEFIDG